MKRVWAISLIAAATLAVAGASLSAPGGLFVQRLREAHRRFAARRHSARRPVISVRPTPAKPAPRRGMAAGHAVIHVARAVRPAASAPRRHPQRVASRPRAQIEDEPILAVVPRGPNKPVVSFSFEPRMPGKRMPDDTGDVLFSTYPHGLKVYFKFERGDTSSTHGVLIQGLDPQELHVRATAPSLALEIETILPIRAGQMTQAQFFFPEHQAAALPAQPLSGGAGRERRPAE